MWYLYILSKQLNKIAELLIQNGVGFSFFFSYFNYGEVHFGLQISPLK